MDGQKIEAIEIGIDISEITQREIIFLYIKFFVRYIILNLVNFLFYVLFSKKY